jgi:hypothetical protein
VGQAGCKSGPLYYPVRLHVAQLSVLDYGTEVLYRTIIELYASRQKQAGVQFASTVGGSAYIVLHVMYTAATKLYACLACNENKMIVCLNFLLLDISA